MYVTTHDEASGLTTVSLARGQAVLAPFVPPEIRRFEVVRALLLAVRVAMTVWAFTLGAVAARSADDVDSLDRAVRTLTIIGVVIAALWFVLGAVWSAMRTRNILQLEGRYPTRWRAVRVWVYAPVWIALMSVTLVRLEPHPDLDIRPPIIVVGFVLAMLPIYRIVQRVFRSLVRVRPDAATFVLFVVDTIAFGLIWWRIATWPASPGDIDSTTTDLITSAAFAAAIALLVGLLAAVYLDLETDRAEDTRLLAIRTRHDHRIARLQGLDPLESATRWALWTARQAADRAAAGAGATDSMAPATTNEPPAPATIEPVGPTVDTIVAPAAEPEAPLTMLVERWFDRPDAGSPAAPSDDERPAESAATTSRAVQEENVASAGPGEGAEQAEPAEELLPTLPPALPATPPSAESAPTMSAIERIRQRVAETERAVPVTPDPTDSAPDEAVPDTAAAGDQVGAGRDDTPDAGGTDSVDGDVRPDDRDAADGTTEPSTADDALARALRRRFAEAERDAQRPRRRPGGAAVPPAAEPIGERGRRLAASIGAELDRGVRSDFADRVRALSQHFDPSQAVPGQALPEQRSAEPGPVASSPSPLHDEQHAQPPRLIALELVRYLTLAVLVIGAIASGWMLLAVSRFGAPDSTFDIDRLDDARSIVVHTFIAAGVGGLGWMTGAAWYASRIDPTLRVWPFAVLLGVAVPGVVAATALEGGSAGAWSLGAMIVTAISVTVALRLLLPVFDTFVVTTWTVNAWLFDTVATVVFILASPLGSEIVGGVNAGRVAFGAVLVGLSSTVGAVIVALTTTDYENSLRGSTELARVIESRRARSRDTS